ncbi:MAG: ferredoxin III, nif-specific [Alphaproteobacteria bacterium CG_4_10_14_0_2_um_filter_63_37]|nr:MAG: ferredoxin III, nif-specific [Proteobacteria bacterium CG1_02_64_396]PJA25201.1 MAG: ferredoxin III, nif-specific [Alphaproteobacteria bacterium CG_4_10_14_0_2_um_filter_63_37]
MSDVITGITRGGSAWTPQFIKAVDPENCIGCGRCYKVCPRDVFDLVEKSELVEMDDDDFDDDDNAMVMAIKDALDCIGCLACSKVCPKECHSHAPAAVGA